MSALETRSICLLLFPITGAILQESSAYAGGLPEILLAMSNTSVCSVSSPTH